jgi:DNA-binding Lrp family transcriptional regulator
MHVPGALERPDERLLQRMLEGFPLAPRPFAALGASQGLHEEDVLELLGGWLSRGVLRRFGPIFQIEMAPPRFGLVGVGANDAPFEELAARLCTLDVVALLRRRRHRFGLWLLLAAGDAAEEDEAVSRIARIVAPAPLVVFRGADAAADSATGRRTTPAEGRLLRALGSGLPMLPRPYEALAATLGLDEADVRAMLARWLDEGLVQRIGALPPELPQSLRGAAAFSAVALWDIDDAARDEALGRLERADAGRAGLSPLVTRLRWRERQPPLWRFNLWLKLQGASAAELAARRQRIDVELEGLARGVGDVLPAWPTAPGAASGATDGAVGGATGAAAGGAADGAADGAAQRS